MLCVVGYASLDYSTSVSAFRGVNATSVLQRAMVTSEPGVGGIAHIVRAARSVGVETEAVSWVGPDEQGATWIETLIRTGCGTSGVSRSGTRSPGATLIEVGTGGTICLFDPADCHPTQLSEAQRAVLTRSSCAVLTVAPSTLTAEALDVLPARTPLIWAVKHDDDAYTPDLLQRLLQRADIVSFSEGERSYVSLDGVEPEFLVKPGALVVETKGPRGVSWAFGSATGAGRPGVVHVEPVAVHDTTGAGDTFIGTLAGVVAQSAPLSERTDQDVATVIESACQAAGSLLRRRTLRGPAAAALPKETL